MTQALSEDDIYRASTQYRIWSFSPEILSSTRKQTHAVALERARRNLQNAGSTIPSDFLSEEDELKLVLRYCEQLRATSEHLQYPPSTKATAVQYLRRFYTSNSVITYPPKEIYKTVLYLACKSEGQHVNAGSFAHRIATDREMILAPEFKIMQALRFTLEVKQPFRGLKGVLMELLNMAAGIGAAEETQQSMLGLDIPSTESRTVWKAKASGKVTPRDLSDRVQAMYQAARSILDKQALLTDVYFLYTPSQILLAALQLADKPLAELYFNVKLPLSLPSRAKILATMEACFDVLSSFSDDSIMSKDDRAAMEEKLEKCRDPTTRDLVKLHAAAKAGDSDAEDDKSKKRNHIKEGEDLFGPNIKTNGTGKG